MQYFYYHYYRLGYWLTKGQGRHALDSLKPSVTLLPCEFPQAINNLKQVSEKQVFKQTSRKYIKSALKFQNPITDAFFHMSKTFQDAYLIEHT